jgi:uncharacterized protein YjdB
MTRIIKYRWWVILIVAFLLCGSAAANEAVIPVRSVEVGDYKERITIDETVELEVSVQPEGATDATVTYASSNAKIITVTSKGKVKGIGKGAAKITLSAGGVRKAISFTVIGAKTDSIALSKEYLVLAPKETYKIIATPKPKNADGNVKFKSLNKKVAKVGADGTVKAVGSGSASIIVSNEDMTVSASVIVGESNAKSVRNVGKAKAADKVNFETDNNITENETETEEDGLVSQIKQASGMISVAQAECAVLAKPVLKILSEANKSLKITSAVYELIIKGADIINPENEISTGIVFEESDDGVGFTLNNGGNLAGKIELKIMDDSLKRKYLYLFNESKSKYERINSIEGDVISIDQAGKYLISDEKLGFSRVGIWLAVSAGVIIIFAVAFIVARRRYWFW